MLEKLCLKLNQLAARFFLLFVEDQDLHRIALATSMEKVYTITKEAHKRLDRFDADIAAKG